MSLFRRSFPCHNSSVFEESVCHGNGICANTTGAECVCDGQYVKETYCSTTVSEELNYANYPFYLLTGVAYAILIIVISYDFIIDMKLKVWPSMKRPIAIGKIALWLSSVFIFIQVVFYYLDSSANRADRTELGDLMRFISDFTSLVTYSISALSWISVILTAKNLGEMKGSLKYFRRYVIVMNSVLLPIYFLVGVANLVIATETFSYVFLAVVILMLVFYLSLILGTAYFIRKAFIWVRSLDDSMISATTKRVKLKTYFLVGANIFGSFRYLLWVFKIFEVDTTTEIHLYYLVMYTTKAALFAFFLLILENHVIRLPIYLRTGEIRSNTLLPGSSAPSTSKTKTKRNSKPQMNSSTSSHTDISNTATLQHSNPHTASDDEYKHTMVTAEHSLVTSSNPSSSSSQFGSASSAVTSSSIDSGEG